MTEPDTTMETFARAAILCSYAAILWSASWFVRNVFFNIVSFFMENGWRCLFGLSPYHGQQQQRQFESWTASHEFSSNEAGPPRTGGVERVPFFSAGYRSSMANIVDDLELFDFETYSEVTKIGIICDKEDDEDEIGNGDDEQMMCAICLQSNRRNAQSKALKRGDNDDDDNDDHAHSDATTTATTTTTTIAERNKKVNKIVTIGETDAEELMNSLTRTLPCGHTFHLVCIDRWILKECKNTCPECKTSLLSLNAHTFLPDPSRANARASARAHDDDDHVGDCTHATETASIPPEIVDAVSRTKRLIERDSYVKNGGCVVFVASNRHKNKDVRIHHLYAEYILAAQSLEKRGIHCTVHVSTMSFGGELNSTDSRISRVSRVVPALRRVATSSSSTYIIQDNNHHGGVHAKIMFFPKNWVNDVEVSPLFELDCCCSQGFSSGAEQLQSMSSSSSSGSNSIPTASQIIDAVLFAEKELVLPPPPTTSVPPST